MFCRSCGKQLPDDSAFCEFCGAQLGGAQPGGGALGQPPQPGQNPQMTPQYQQPAPAVPQYPPIPHQQEAQGQFQPVQGQFQQGQNAQQGAPQKLQSVGKIAGIAAVAVAAVIAAAVILPKVRGGTKEGKDETTPSGITGITVNTADGQQNSGVTGDNSSSLLTLPGSESASSDGQGSQTTESPAQPDGSEAGGGADGDEVFIPSRENALSSGIELINENGVLVLYQGYVSETQDAAHGPAIQIDIENNSDFTVEIRDVRIILADEEYDLDAPASVGTGEKGSFYIPLEKSVNDIFLKEISSGGKIAFGLGYALNGEYLLHNTFEFF